MVGWRVRELRPLAAWMRPGVRYRLSVEHGKLPQDKDILRGEGSHLKRSRLRTNEDLRYEVGDRIPRPLALALGAQLAALALNGAVLMPTIVFRAGGAEEFVVWAVFASVLACGVAAILQGTRVGRIGSGYALTHISSAIFIAVCAEALIQGGPALLATLVVIAAVPPE